VAQGVAWRHTISETSETESEAMTIFAPGAQPLSIDLLVTPDANLLSVAATIDPLRAANRIAGRTLYVWRLVSPDGAPPPLGAGIAPPVAGPFDPAAAHDALVVIASFDVERHATPRLLGALRAAARRRRAVGGVEAGTWLLAKAGLLEGRRATTHWEDFEAFAHAHPEVDLRPDRYVIDGPRFTAGGAAPALDMMLALIRVRQGAAFALDVASVFVYDESLPGEAPQTSVSLGRIRERAPRLAAAVRAMVSRLDAPLPMATIARRAGVSERTLEAEFRRVLGTTPRSYYLALRLGEARRLMRDGAAPVAEVAAATGFSSASAFARAFRERFGESPTAVRRRARARP
jgi:transcriptional regulator GlxA family with amidase domain